MRFELFAAGPADPERLWQLVGDPARLPQWTDVDEVRVTGAQAGSPGPGDTLTTVRGRQRLQWTVLTRGRGLLELSADVRDGRLGVGCRVLRDPLGARLVIACALEPRSLLAGLRFRLTDGPALRRRFDRWCRRALQAAPPSAGD